MNEQIPPAYTTGNTTEAASTTTDLDSIPNPAESVPLVTADDFTLGQFLKAIFSGNWTQLKFYLKTGKGLTLGLYFMSMVGGIFATVTLLLKTFFHDSFFLVFAGLSMIAFSWYLAGITGTLAVLYNLYKKRFRHAVGLFLFFMLIGWGSCAFNGALALISLGLMSTFGINF